jgi:chromosome partitioning protein
MIITLQNQKGGVGKTTLSLHLAHQLTLTGARVLVVDADPQGSARDWLQARESPAPFAVVGLDRPTIHRDIESLLADYDAVVIDSPPRVTDIARSAILAADLVVIPVQPSPLDVWAAQDTVALIQDALVYKEAIRSVFTINREIVNTAIGREVSEALAQTDVPVMRSHISQRVAFAESVAQGQTVFETKSDAKAIAEIEALAAELVEYVGLGSAEYKRRLA